MDTDKEKDSAPSWFHLQKYILEDDKSTQNLCGVLFNLSKVVEMDGEIYSPLLDRKLQFVRQIQRKWTDREFHMGV